MQLKVLGYDVVRLTWRQLASHPAETRRKAAEAPGRGGLDWNGPAPEGRAGSGQ
jgi:hypothetical protein